MKNAISFHRNICIILFFSTLFILSCTSSKSDLDIIESRLYKSTLEKNFFNFTSINDSDLANSESFVAMLKADGSWGDINYKDKDNDWDPLKHLIRMTCIAYNWASPESKHYHDINYLNADLKCIDFWCQSKLTCSNWFKNYITSPRMLGITGLLLRDELGENRLLKLNKFLPSQYSHFSTDVIRTSQPVLYKAIINRDTSLLRNVSEAFHSVFHDFDLYDGIQPDWSFHHHNHHFYTGTYGNELISTCFNIIPLLQGTKYEMTKKDFSYFSGLVTKGLSPLVFGNRLDYSSSGRMIIHDGRNVDKYIPYFEYLKKVNPDSSNFYNEMIEGIRTNKKQSQTGNIYYGFSDFGLQRSKDFYFSVRMTSDRHKNPIESGGENLLGQWLAYGANFMFTQGDEYKNIFPVWDWMAIPGVTNPQSITYPFNKMYNKDDFAGGVTTGKAGVYSMHLNYEKTTAHKSWFLFPNEIVALGTDITSTYSENVKTTINQCLLKGPIYINEQRIDTTECIKILPNSYIWHNDFAYIFPKQKADITLRAKTQSGCTNDIFKFGTNDTINKNVFKIQFDHGINPKNQKYEYIILPAICEKATKKYMQKPNIRIICNNSNVQAVESIKDHLFGVVFHNSGSVKLNEKSTITSSCPCIIMTDGINKLWVSDPTQKLDQIKNLIFNKKKAWIILPQGIKKGTTKLCKFNNEREDVNFNISPNSAIFR